MAKIVLSYRRDDARAITNWLYEKLLERYGKESIFRDIDSILPTENFRKRIGRALRDCDFVVAVIGPNWQGRDAEGRSRISATNDWVRVEIETALQLDIPLLPVLVEDADMPQPAELPPSLHEMTEINALSVSSGGARFYEDLERLYATIEKTTGAPPVSTPPAAAGEGVSSDPAKATAAPPASDPPTRTEKPANAAGRASQTVTAGAAKPAGVAEAAGTSGASVPAGSAPKASQIAAFLAVPALLMFVVWVFIFRVDSTGRFAAFELPPSAFFVAGIGFVMKGWTRIRAVYAALAGMLCGVGLTAAAFAGLPTAQAMDGLLVGALALMGGGLVAAMIGFGVATLAQGRRSTP